MQEQSFTPQDSTPPFVEKRKHSNIGVASLAIGIVAIIFLCISFATSSSLSIML